MNRSTPRTRAYEVLAAALEVKIAVDVGQLDRAVGELAKLRDALNDLECELAGRLASATAVGDLAAPDLLKDAEPRRPLGRKKDRP